MTTARSSGVLAVLGEQLAGSLQVVAEHAPLDRELVGLPKAPILAADLGVAGLVRDHGRVRHLALQLGEAAFDLFDEALDHGPREFGGRA